MAGPQDDPKTNQQQPHAGTSDERVEPRLAPKSPENSIEDSKPSDKDSYRLTPTLDIQASGSRLCPKCGKSLTADSVLCIQCGFDFRTGKHVEADVQTVSVPEVSWWTIMSTPFHRTLWVDGLTLMLRWIGWSICLGLALGLVIFVFGWITGIFHRGVRFEIEHIVFGLVVFGVGGWLYLDLYGSLLHRLAGICSRHAGASEPLREGSNWACLVLIISAVVPLLISLVVAPSAPAIGASLVWFLCYPAMALAAFAVTQYSVSPIDVIRLYGLCFVDREWRMDLVRLFFLIPVVWMVVILMSVVLSGSIVGIVLLGGRIVLDGIHIDLSRQFIDFKNILDIFPDIQLRFGEKYRIIYSVAEVFARVFIAFVPLFVVSMFYCTSMHVLGLVLKRNQELIGYHKRRDPQPEAAKKTKPKQESQKTETMT